VGSCEKDDAVVVFTEAEVEGAGAPVVGRLERGDGEAERGRERLAELGDGSRRGSKGRSFGPPTEWVTSDSRKATSISGKPTRLGIPLMASVAATASSKERVLCFTPIHMSSRQKGVFSPALAKVTGSMEVHFTPRVSRQL